LDFLCWHVDTGSNLRRYSWRFVTTIRVGVGNISKNSHNHTILDSFFTHRLSINIREIHLSILQQAEKSRNLEWSDRTTKTENGSRLMNQYELLFWFYLLRWDSVARTTKIHTITLFFQPVIVILQIKFWIYFLQRDFQYLFWFYLLRWDSVANSSSLSHYYAYIVFLCYKFMLMYAYLIHLKHLIMILVLLFFSWKIAQSFSFFGKGQ
jgi:hypothetical protein